MIGRQWRMSFVSHTHSFNIFISKRFDNSKHRTFSISIGIWKFSETRKSFHCTNVFGVSELLTQPIITNDKPNWSESNVKRCTQLLLAVWIYRNLIKAKDICNTGLRTNFNRYFNWSSLQIIAYGLSIK